MMEDKSGESTEFLKKFGYRSYSGGTTSRRGRVLSIMDFEVRSTWSKSTWGKVILVMVTVMNFFTILIVATISAFGGNGISSRDNVNEFVANYISFGDSDISSNTNTDAFVFSPGLIGILLISLFAIAGSGYFADDKSGKVVEIYLSRIAKREYIVGKIGGLLLYINIFLFGPLLLTSAIMIQSLDESHIEFLDFYFGLLLFTICYSIVVGLVMLTLSSLVEKRQYASLGFFILYLLGTIMGDIVYYSNTNNEFLLLISPSTFLALLAYVCLGDSSLAVRENFFDKTPLNLNDGVGLEYYHVIATFLLYILFFGSILSYKIRKLTTEEL